MVVAGPLQADPGPNEEPTEAYVAIMASLEQDHPTIQLPPSIIAADKADKVLLLHADTTGKLPRSHRLCWRLQLWTGAGGKTLFVYVCV